MATRHLPTVVLDASTEIRFQKLERDTQLKLTLGIINVTGRTLIVVTRSGLRFTLPSLRIFTQNTVYFSESLTLHKDGKADVALSDEPFQDSPSQAQRMLESLQAKMAVPSFNRGYQAEAKVYHELHRDAILEAGGTVYIPSLDIVVSFHESSKQLHHPFSEEGIRASLKASDEFQQGLKLHYYIVDNRKTYGERYMNVNGRVYRIPCCYRPDMADGFYAVHPRPTLVGGVQTETITTKMTVEEAEKTYCLYRTPEEAETFGFSKEALERENLTMKRDASQKAFDREETKAERDARLQEEAAEAKRRQYAREDREQTLNHVYGTLKVVASILVACISLSTVLIKAFGKK